MSEISEQDVRNLAVQHRELHQQAESIRQQMGMVQLSLEDCTRAIATIDELDAVSGSINTMLPLGGGTFIHANVSNVEKIVVGLGAGVSAEKSPAEAKELLNRRKEELGKVVERLNGSLSQIGQRLQSIESMIGSRGPQ
ncbi:prefoldin subunit alpha [Methanococcoides sp. FTZ1]|uniref:prefoldin subunit alpha n=1 Tax=Methanococcoides sp. FTZ1 TaxID=3439061 RepID=UPI003F871D67